MQNLCPHCRPTESESVYLHFKKIASFLAGYWHNLIYLSEDNFGGMKLITGLFTVSLPFRWWKKENSISIIGVLIQRQAWRNLMSNECLTWVRPFAPFHLVYSIALQGKFYYIPLNERKLEQEICCFTQNNRDSNYPCLDLSRTELFSTWAMLF